MTEFLYPAELSHSATTGPSDCSNGGFNRCFFDVNGEQSESLMVTDDEIDFLVNVFGTCELTILAVGGGGEGGGQGGGSGNIHYEKILESSDGITNFTLNARAGGGSTASSVPHYTMASWQILERMETLTIEAEMVIQVAESSIITLIVEELMDPQERVAMEVLELLRILVNISLKHGS